MKPYRRIGQVFQSSVFFSLGALAGSLVTLLCAPASGHVTRKRLLRKARHLQRTATRRIHRTQRVLVSEAGAMRHAAGEWIAEHIPANGRQTSRRRLAHASR